jgi:hypothetical protein
MRRAAGPPAWAWFAPVGLAFFVYATHGKFLERGVAAGLALLVIALAARRPDRALLLLLAGLPFGSFLLAQLYAWGVPAPLVRPLSSWKEALALGVVVAGVQGFRAGCRKLDRLDGLALALVALVGAYALAPGFFAPGAPLDGTVRSLAFRSTAGFVILLLAARHARLPEDFLARAGRVVLAVGGIVAGIAVYEYFFSASWNQFVIERIEYLRYQIDVLDAQPFSLTEIRRYGYIGGSDFLRSGSVFLDPTTCGFFLLLPFAIAVEQRLRAARHAGPGLLLPLLTAGLLLTQTRAALVGALVVVFLAIRPAVGRPVHRRLQFGLMFAACLILALPAAAATGLSQRASTTASGDDQSGIDHVESFWDGIGAITEAPLGHGLGTSAGVGQRFASARTTITENAYLQMGVEVGVLGMVLFIALTLLTLRRLRAAARSGSDTATWAIRSAGIGLAFGALLLHTWSDFAVAWTYWALAGAAIGLAERGGTAPIAPTEDRRGRGSFTAPGISR